MGDQFRARWQEPVVQLGESVQKNTLLARGVTNIYYPADIWIFTLLVFIFELATGIGEGSDYRMIPEQFPGPVGTVGGTVGLIGALGGFVLPMAFAINAAHFRVFDGSNLLVASLRRLAKHVSAYTMSEGRIKR